jgi:hypothetical protein
MHKITLVCSVHRENGLCNAAELLKILRTIEPDVIFEEVRPSDVDSYYKWTLEAQAIAKYFELKLFQRVPVDRFDMPGSLFATTQEVFDCVERASQEYLELTEENNINVQKHGFKYLNGDACATILTRISEIELETVIRTGDQSLIRGLESWRQALQKRDHEMVGNVYKYCRDNAFDTGVFLVGAGHKLAIVKEIEKYASGEGDLISWNFAYEDRPIGPGL